MIRNPYDPRVSARRTTDRPRAAHITTAHRADDVRIFQREGRSLAAAGFEVVLVAPSSGRSPIGVRHIPLPPPPKLRVGRFMTAAWRAGAALRGIDADIYHFHDPELIPLAMAVARTGRVVVWDAHEDYVTKFAPTRAGSWVPLGARRTVSRLSQSLLRGIDREASAVIAATEGISATYNNTRTVVVGNEARYSDYVDCHPSPSSRTILFTGQASRAHLFPEVVQATVELGDTRLLVAGRPVDPRLWRAAKGALNDRIDHLGWLDRAGLRSAISRCAVGLGTYAPLPNYQDPRGSPTKVFEFAAAGLPIVATPNPALRRLVEGNGLGVVSRGFSSAELAKATSQVLDSGDRWREMSWRSRQWARGNSWERSSEPILLATYRAILGERVNNSS